MPKITVYIRNEDMDKWRAVEKKSEWMHTRLNFESTTITSSDVPMTTTNPSMLKQVDTASLKKGILKNLPSCKHGANPDFCKFARNGKPCK